MNEIQKKYKLFSIDENMKEMFNHPSIEIENIWHNKPALLISTVIIDDKGKLSELKDIKNAKLV